MVASNSCRFSDSMCSRTTASRRSRSVVSVICRPYLYESLRMRRESGCMPYELSLEADLDRGGSVYRVAFERSVEAASVRRLSDWLANARLNPDAKFVIDLSEGARTTPRARMELRALLRRHRQLTAARRLTVVTPARRSAGALQLAPVLALSLPL